MKVLLTGGGTLGSVNPLIAIYEEAKQQHKNWDWFWIGTKKGIEREVVEELGINYEWVPSAKLRRYVSLHILIDPFLFAFSFFRSLLIIATIKPDVVIGAGSFISVPVIWASWIFRKKIIIHQQDIRPTLSNVLCKKLASHITVSFKKSLLDYPKNKTEWIGNPVRNALTRASAKQAVSKFGLNPDLPLLLITGGSSGARALNQWVWKNLDTLAANTQVVHLAGKGKQDEQYKHQNYIQREIVAEEMFGLMASTDLIVSRGGVSTITELSYLGKAAIIVPMPGSHQEDNAYYASREHAAVIFRQDQLNEQVVAKVQELLHSSSKRENLERAMAGLIKKGARERMVEIISEYEK